ALLPQRQLSSRLIAHHHALGMRPIAAARSIEPSDHGRKNGDAGGLTLTVRAFLHIRTRNADFPRVSLTHSIYALIL
ncbi:MAG TPA: hypothetical protein VFA39_14580, partial [Steroidobacteraceae bacterium]|nr:hypothetical protein [Steroidobacteraceae bacterium]